MATTLSTTASGHSSAPSRVRAAAAGMRDMLPLLAGIAPFGMVIGVTGSEHGLSPLVTLSSGLFVYSGSAQLAALELIAGGATPVVVLATVLAVNARLLLYSAAIGPQWRGTRPAGRALSAYLLVDPSFVVGMRGYDRPRPYPGNAHYLGGAVLLWVTWQSAIATGMTVGSLVPESVDLAFVVPLYLVAQLVPRAKDGAARTAVAVGAATAAATTTLPLHLGLPVAIVAGIAAGHIYKEHTR
ncbi:MAG: AzlC family ABC transporter permease [Nocardioidaceae bacterium]